MGDWKEILAKVHADSDAVVAKLSRADGELSTPDVVALVRAKNRQFADDITRTKFWKVNLRGEDCYYVWYTNAVGKEESTMVRITDKGAIL
jgi:hypothetical protein